jgi:hypothetical protein
MLEKDQSSNREKFMAIYDLHVKKTLQYLFMNNIPFIEVVYKELIQNPKKEIEKITSFLELYPDVKKLEACINIDFYRNRN